MTCLRLLSGDLAKSGLNEVCNERWEHVQRCVTGLERPTALPCQGWFLNPPQGENQSPGERAGVAEVTL